MHASLASTMHPESKGQHEEPDVWCQLRGNDVPFTGCSARCTWLRGTGHTPLAWPPVEHPWLRAFLDKARVGVTGQQLHYAVDM